MVKLAVFFASLLSSISIASRELYDPKVALKYPIKFCAHVYG